MTACESATEDGLQSACRDVNVIIAAGAAGVELLSTEARREISTLKVAIDLNAVPPLGLPGIEVTDTSIEKDGVTCYGAIGVGGLKMSIHKAAIEKLFAANDQVLDTAAIYAIGRGLA